MKSDNLPDTLPLTYNEPRPRIYVVCFASYYETGKLFGDWIDATQSVKDILEQIKQLLANSPMPGAEKFIIRSYLGFYSLEIDEYESIEAVHNKALFISKYGELGSKLITCYGGTLEYAQEALQKHYHGQYKSKLDYAIYLFDKIYFDTIPKLVRDCIDYEKYKAYIFNDDYLSIEVQGRCHIFDRHW